MAQEYTDLTNRLDELFAKGAFSEFTPEVTDCAKEVRAGSAMNINERGAFYLSLIELPMNFTSDNFGSNAGASFGDAGKIAYLKQVLTALKRMATVKWQDEVEVQSSNPALLQRPGKSVQEKMKLIASHLAAYAVHWSRELWGDKTNELARVSAINTGTKVVTCANTGNKSGVYNLHVGQQVMFYNGSSARTGGDGYVTITTVNPDNRTFSYAATDAHPASQTAPSSIANGDIIYPSLGTTSLKDKGLAGVKYLLGTNGAFQGVADRTINQHLMGTYRAAGGAVLSASFLRQMKSAQKYKLWGKKGKGKWYASAQYDAYEATELGKQSFAQDSDTMKKGYRKLYFDDAPFEQDFYIPRDAVVYADLSQIDRFELKAYAPVRDEAGYERQVPGTNTYVDMKQVLFRGYEQLGCEQPSMLGVWGDGLSTDGLEVGYSS